MPNNVKQEFFKELDQWIADGWLRPYDGDFSGLVPLMAVVQPNKGNVRPVMDYREVNQYISSHNAQAEVCGEKLRKWRTMGDNAQILDLRKAYLGHCTRK
jgi:hypothetical protein